MRHNNNFLSSDVNICFLAISLLLCFLITGACAYPKREHPHNDELHHQLLELPSRSIPMHHSRLHYGTTPHPLWPQRSRCQCRIYRNQHNNDREEVVQLHTTEGPNGLETTHESAAIEQRPSKRGPHVKVYDGARRSCYCPRKGFPNRKEQEEADNIVQRQPYHLHKVEDTLQNEISDEKTAERTNADSEKEHRRHRRHHHDFPHHFGHDSNHMPHNHEFGMHPHGNHPHHEHQGGFNCQHKHPMGFNAFHRENRIITTTTEPVTTTTTAAAIIVTPTTTPTIDSTSISVLGIDLRNNFNQEP